MAEVIIKIAPSHLRRQYGEFDVAHHLHEYKVYPQFHTFETDFAAANEAFDLTNNPSRQLEREQVYGCGPSVSIGDVVEVDGLNYICRPVGWDIVGMETA